MYVILSLYDGNLLMFKATEMPEYIQPVVFYLALKYFVFNSIRNHFYFRKLYRDRFTCA